MSTINDVTNTFFSRYDRNADGRVRTSRGFLDILLFRRPEVGGTIQQFANKIDQQALNRHYIDKLDLSDYVRRNVDVDNNGEISGWEKALLWARDRQAFEALF